MCFSATASFVTAGVVAAIGAAALSRVKEPSELPLAGTPVLFGLQQAVEGLQWLTLPLAPGSSISTGLTVLYLFFAEVLWPVYAPIAVWLVEPSERRRQVMVVCLAVGVGVGAYLLWPLFTQPHSASIVKGHIVYVTENRHSEAVGLSYLAATCLPLILSSQRTLVVLGAVVLIGSGTAYLLYWEAFVSVWCFFAAAASVVILYHFEQSRRRRTRLAGT